MNKTFYLNLNRLAYFFPIFLLWGSNSYGQGNLFFSEYIEGDGGCCNKCLEIFNPTSSTVDLSTYRIEFYNNGKTTTGNASFSIGERVPFSTLAPSQVVVLCQSKADISLQSVSDGIFGFGNYNGNDAIVLRHNGGIIDIIGAIGCDPGTAWRQGGNSTVNNTLIRKSCIQKGNATGDCAFSSLGSEWLSLGANNFSNLGSHETGIPVVKISGDNALCERPSITLTATAGFTAYRWSNGSRTNSTTITNPGTYQVTVTSDLGCTATATKNINGQSPAITATISDIQAVSCIPKKDGGFTVNPNGGSGGFSYAWETGTSTSPVINGVGAGNYQVTITDNNGCSVVAPVGIGGPITVPLMATASGETCENRQDGSITLAASGSGLSYSIGDGIFQANNQFTNLAPGDYLAQVQDNTGCGDQELVTVDGGTNFDLRNSRVVQVNCQGGEEGGQIILRPQGGQAPYQFSFSGGSFTEKRVYSNLEGGIFDIIVRDASGCEKVFQQEIEAGSDMEIGHFEITPATCEGVNNGGILIELTGGSGNISYNKEVNGRLRPFFSPNFTDLLPGKHQIIVRDNLFDCQLPVNFEIPMERTLIADVSTSILCETSQEGHLIITPQNGNGPYQYSLDSSAFVMDSIFFDLPLQTYLITTKDNDGCITTDSFNFEAAVNFEIVFAVPNPESCIGNEDGQINIITNKAEGVTYSLDGINFSENNVFAGLAPRDYIAYAQSGDCMATKTVTISAAEEMILEQVIPEITLCEGEDDGQLTVVVTGGTAPYTYQLNETLFQTTPIFANLAQGIYTLTVKDSNQCEQIFTDIILPGPVRLDPECEVAQHVSIFNGTDGIANMVIFGGAAPYKVQLINADFNNILSLDGLVTFTNLSAGDYLAEVTDDNGCQSTCEFIIEAPQCDFSISNTHTNATCFDSLNGTISLILPIENAPFTIKWSDSLYNGQQNLLELAPGEYTTTVTDAIGCMDSVTVIITKPAPLAAAIDITNAVICAQDSTQLNLTKPFATYLWSNGTDAATTFVYETGTYQVTVEDEVGCVATDEIAITVLAQDTILENRFTCEEMSVGTFRVEERNENGCINVTFRTFELARKDTTEMVTTTCNPIDTGMFQTTLTNAFGCDSVLIITTNLLPSDTIYQTLVSCNNEEIGRTQAILLTNQFGCDSLIIIATISGISEPTTLIETTCEEANVGVDTFRMTNHILCDSLIIITTILNPSHAFSITEESCNPQDTGLFIQSFLNEFGCDSIVTIRTTLSPINACQIGFIATPDTICWDETIGTIQLNIYTGNPPFNYYLLDDFYRDTLQSGIILTNEISLTNIPIGAYTIFLANDRGVRREERLAITTSPILDIAAQISDYNGFAISCMGEVDGSINLKTTGGNAPYTYLWEGGETTENLQDLASGNYEVTVTDAHNCTNSTTFNLTANEALTIEFQATNQSCFDNDIGQITIHDLPNVNGVAEYSLDGLLFQPIGELPFTIENLPSGAYELFVQDENDCQVSTSFNIPPSTDYQLTLGENQHLFLGDSLRLVPEANFDITRFEWTATNPLICSDCSTIKTIPMQDGQYFLTAYDVNGCSITASSVVKLIKERPLFIPNVFSPNGDGLNDRYQVFVGKSVHQINQFSIYDYEGRLMYQVNNWLPNDAPIGWDGRFNGQKMLPAVFVVLVEVELIDGTIQQYSETITLMK